MAPTRLVPYVRLTSTSDFLVTRQVNARPSLVGMHVTIICAILATTEYSSTGVSSNTMWSVVILKEQTV